MGNVICLTPEQVSAASACDYDFTVTVDALTNWSDIVTSLQTNGFQSSHYVLTTVFGHAYTSSPHASFDGGDALLRLDPVALHGSVHLISRFLQSLEPPTIVLANASRSSVSFLPRRAVAVFLPPRLRALRVVARVLSRRRVGAGQHGGRVRWDDGAAESLGLLGGMSRRLQEPRWEWERRLT